MNNQHKYPYRWTLADANFTKNKGKVFSCFSCGGGSTMVDENIHIGVMPILSAPDYKLKL